jgi:hypothetical protein
MSETTNLQPEPNQIREPMSEPQKKRYQELFAQWKAKNPAAMMPPEQQVYLQEKARIEFPNLKRS